MKHWMSLAFILNFAPLAWSSEAVVEENLFTQYQSQILTEDSTKSSSQAPGFTAFEQKLFVDALEDLANEGSAQALSRLAVIDAPLYDLVEKLRLEILKIKHGQTAFLPKNLVDVITSELLSLRPDVRLIYVIAVYERELLDAGHANLIKHAQQHPEYTHVSQDRDGVRELTPEIISDLFYHSPDVTSYMNGEYVQSIKVFMFCRFNRLYPCLMVMRGVSGDPVRNDDGNLWTHHALASSKAGLPSYSRNGNTPGGILTIDSVMPVADQQLSFGKNRRIILNFIPKSTNEALYKHLLPESSHKHEWWQPSVVARDIGRNLLRIHGTGKINPDPHTPYFPFMRTSGCIAQKENTYQNVTYNDQRKFLDSLMTALDIAPVFENEPKIKGILYLVEIDDQNAAVELQDLHSLGIK